MNIENYVGRGLGTLALAGSLFLSGCKDSQSPKPQRPEQKISQEVAQKNEQTDRYKIISQIRGSGTIYELSREKGEIQIADLNREGQYEDSWIFTGNSKWVDIGTHEALASTEPDLQLLRSLIAGEQEVHMYHYHPYTQVGIPSMADLLFYDNLKRMCKSLERGMSYSVVDKQGIWSVNDFRDINPDSSNELFYSMKMDNELQKVRDKYSRDGHVDLDKLDELIRDFKEVSGGTISFRRFK